MIRENWKPYFSNYKNWWEYISFSEGLIDLTFMYMSYLGKPEFKKMKKREKKMENRRTN